MNLGLVHYLALFILIVVFPVREYYIRKRIIKIYSELRKTIPLTSNEIDLTGLKPVIKYSSTEQILGKIEKHLSEARKNNPKALNQGMDPTESGS